MEPLAAVIELLRKALPDLQAVYLFGSRATGDAGPGSDYDLAVLPPRPIDSVDRWVLQERLAEILRTDVDLVDLRAASTVMRASVLRTARTLYDGAPTERAFFEAYALADYARLNEERRGILEDIHERGNIYG